MECSNTEVLAMFYFIDMNRSNCICFENKAKVTWILDSKWHVLYISGIVIFFHFLNLSENSLFLLIDRF